MTDGPENPEETRPEETPNAGPLDPIAQGLLGRIVATETLLQMFLAHMAAHFRDPAGGVAQITQNAEAAIVGTPPEPGWERVRDEAVASIASMRRQVEAQVRRYAPPRGNA